MPPREKLIGANRREVSKKWGGGGVDNLTERKRKVGKVNYAYNEANNVLIARRRQKKAVEEEKNRRDTTGNDKEESRKKKLTLMRDPLFWEKNQMHDG